MVRMITSLFVIERTRVHGRICISRVASEGAEECTGEVSGGRGGGSVNVVGLASRVCDGVVMVFECICIRSLFYVASHGNPAVAVCGTCCCCC